jgi:hypothetical protein
MGCLALLLLMRLPHRYARSLLCALGLLVQLSIWLPRPVCAEEPDIPEDLKLPSLWVKSIDPRLWAGYKDNVLLSAYNVMGSPFVAGGLDLTFYRLPVNGWEYLFLTSAEYVRYFSASKVDQEATAIVQAQATKTFAEHWKTGISAEYVYFNEVVDSSAFPEVLTSMPVQGHSFTVRPSMGRDFGTGYRLELELPTTRQLFEEFIDDYWEVGPKLTFAREYGHKSEFNMSYQFGDRLHDTREARDAAGVLVSGRELEFYEHELSFIWRHKWDAARHWRTLTKLALQRNEDNGGGYYDYWRPLISEQLRYEAMTWAVRAEARISYYGYDHQPIAELGSAVRQKTYLRFNVRGEKTLTKSMRVFAQFEHDQALSNLKIDRYDANTFSAGLDWQF